MIRKFRTWWMAIPPKRAAYRLDRPTHVALRPEFMESLQRRVRYEDALQRSDRRDLAVRLEVERVGRGFQRA